MKIYNNFIEKCKGPALNPKSPNEECCEQLDIFYPMYDTCINIYKEEEDVAMSSKDTLLKNYNICNPPPPSCPDDQKWSSTKNKCEYQCRCIKLFPSDVCNSDIEKECNNIKAKENWECSGKCAWYD